MSLNFRALAGSTGDREELPESGAARQLLSAKATRTVDGESSAGIRPLGAEATGGLAEIGYPVHCKLPSRNQNLRAAL